MNVDLKDGSHARKSVQRRNRNSASPVLHVVLADAQSLRCLRRTHASPVEGSVEARPDSAPKGVVLVTALEVPDWISMSSHVHCISQFISILFSADFFAASVNATHSQ